MKDMELLLSLMDQHKADEKSSNDVAIQSLFLIARKSILCERHLKDLLEVLKNSEGEEK